MNSLSLITRTTHKTQQEANKNSQWETAGGRLKNAAGGDASNTCTYHWRHDIFLSRKSGLEGLSFALKNWNLESPSNFWTFKHQFAVVAIIIPHHHWLVHWKISILTWNHFLTKLWLIPIIFRQWRAYYWLHRGVPWWCKWNVQEKKRPTP